MGIRCLFGHDFGGREVERDRREDGNEVLVTYRTVETCERCGSRRVVSENKEIKPIGSVSDAADRGPATPETGAEPGPSEEPASPEAGEARTDSPETDRQTDGPTAEADDATPEAVAAPTGGGTADASEDAAIIIDDAPSGPGDGGTERSVGGDATDASDTTDAGGSAESQTPDLDAAVASEPETELLDGSTDGASGDKAPADDTGAWPDVGADDDGFDADSPTASGPSVSTDPDSSPAPWPEQDGVERDRNGTKFVRPESETPDPDAATEFYCPNCGATQPSSASSLRSGDVCPECRKGYLAERSAER